MAAKWIAFLTLLVLYLPVLGIMLFSVGDDSGQAMPMSGLAFYVVAAMGFIFFGSFALLNWLI